MKGLKRKIKDKPKQDQYQRCCSRLPSVFRYWALYWGAWAEAADGCLGHFFRYGHPPAWEGAELANKADETRAKKKKPDIFIGYKLEENLTFSKL